ncbi:chloride channel protein [Flavobacterium sp. MAH-1]|uniref:Chloride channel protein n=1 Tax=Flavobacterium agri TaxID=2743471 RepID=A0A7Y9C473_9FLAO|nr:chloride channel protein [Flavobacterium agri]NUY79861.1 chloride channel protein [Flavobacterium agri]NYA69886.1 chloride channel protein [Flavobacterium agri]
MPERKISAVILLLRKIARQFERLFFIAKTLLSERHFIYLSCVVVALSCALAVIVLKSFAHYVFVFANYVNTYLKLPYINSIFPIIGIVLTVFVIRNFLDGSLEKGSSRILYAIAKKGGIMPRKQMYAQIVTSSLTVGLGGSAGLESPITITGAAIGSNFAQKYRLSQKDRLLLLACGVAAGIGAAFNAPIAGVLFAIEVVLTDVTISAFVPIIISAATGALVSTVLLNEEVLLSFKSLNTFDYRNIPFYILLGILAGFVSLYHARNFQRVEKFFSRMKNKAYKRAFFGATILGILIFFFPLLFGEGYESIKTLSNENPSALLDNTLLERFKDNDWILLAFLGITMLLKAFATGLTLGSGGNGGNFAPSLFVGSYLGFFVSKLVNMTGLMSHQLPVGNFTIVGMAGILSGLFHAPLTAIFLIGEITGGYGLMVPLMIVSSISYAVSKQFEKHSMDVKHLADKDEVFTSDKDKNILLSIDILKLVHHEAKWLKPDDTMETLVDYLSQTKQEVFPVIDEKYNLVGIVCLDAIRPVIFNSFRIKFTPLKEIISPVTEVISLEEGIANAVHKFETSGIKTLPVIKNGKYFGLLSEVNVLEAYREQLKQMVIE